MGGIRPDGREITIGGARLRVRERITRCKATTVNPDTGRVQGDTLARWRPAYGHRISASMPRWCKAARGAWG
jgi:hypothetical protein